MGQRSKAISLSIVLLLGILTGCGNKGEQTTQAMEMEVWLEEAKLEAKETPEELYDAALLEDTLVIYSISSRAFEVKKKFEEDYPGLTVEIKDVRSNDIISMLKENYQQEKYLCDIAICSDSGGGLYKELIEPKIVYPYFPWDIVPKMKNKHADTELVFLGEALMLFYNRNIFETAPIENIWELTENIYKGKISMANPLHSSSTYGFSTAILQRSDLLEQAYEDYAGEKIVLKDGKSAGEIFLEKVAKNVVFANSSDEVLEMLGNENASGAGIGIMISSKMRYQELGYEFEAIYQLNPFSAVYTPNSVMVASGAKNINSAKLFIRYLLGETDGKGAGIKPFSTAGTWATRTDVADGNEVPLEEISMIAIDKNYLYENREEITLFWEEILKENLMQ